jgi:hypothetical protein
MRLELGTGSQPSGVIALGGLAKASTFFGSGTDLALVGRVATGGFVRGGWGLALDGGAYDRLWGSVHSSGFDGALVLGGPWGVQACVDYQDGSGDVKSYAAFVGIDFLRLTVYRSTGTAWLPNPFPAVPPTPDR